MNQRIELKVNREGGNGDFFDLTIDKWLNGNLL